MPVIFAIALVVFSALLCPDLHASEGQHLLTDQSHPGGQGWWFPHEGIQTAVVKSAHGDGGTAAWSLACTLPAEGQVDAHQTGTNITAAIHSGDHLTLALWLRAPTGKAQVRLKVQRADAPYEAMIDSRVEVGPEWKEVVVTGTAGFALDPWKGAITIFVGGAGAVTVEMGRLRLSTTTEPPPQTLALAIGAAPFPAVTIQGWGMFPGYFQRDWGPDFQMFDRPKIQEAVFALKPDFIRLKLYHHMYQSGTTAQDLTLIDERVQDLADMLQLAAKHGVTRYILASWSPPHPFKTLGSELGRTPGIENGYQDNNTNGQFDPGEPISYLRDDREESLAHFFVKVLQALQARGCTLPVALAVQNEPDVYQVNYMACRMEPEQWRRVVKTTRRIFDQAGLQAVTLFSTDDNPPSALSVDRTSSATWGFLGGAGYPALGRDRELDQAIGAYAIHAYNLNYQHETLNSLTRHPKPLWMSEWCDMGSGEGVSDPDGLLLHNARRVAAQFDALPISFWAHWTIWAKSHSLIDPVSGDQDPVLGPKYFLYQTLFRTVRPGWQARRVATDDPQAKPFHTTTGDLWELNQIAFASPDGRSWLLMLTNNAVVERHAITITGLPATGSSTFSQVTRDGLLTLSAGALNGGTLQLGTFPARSVCFVSITP